MLRKVGVGIGIFSFFRICRKTKICYKMAKTKFIFLIFFFLKDIHDFEILAFADFHNIKFFFYYFCFWFFGIFGFWRLRGKIYPHEKKKFHQKLRLKKLGIYMGVRISIDKERRKPYNKNCLGSPRWPPPLSSEG